MKKFKSILALTASVLALSAFAAPVSAFASDPTIDQDSTPKTGDMTVNGGEDVRYTVVIPASVDVDDTENNTKNVVVYNAFLEKGKSVFVKATSAYGDGSNFKMALLTDGAVASGETVKAEYTVTADSTQITSGVNFLEVKQANLVTNGSQTDATATTLADGLETPLTFALDGTYPVAGSYQDTLTFTISYGDSN